MSRDCLAPSLAIVVLLAPSIGRARCDGREEARWSIHQQYVMLLNPMGLEHNVRLGLCVPLYRADDSILADNHVEVGISNYAAPVYTLGGGYVQVSPATFLFVRAELNAYAIWPLPLSGAGYFARAGYHDTWSTQSTPEELAGTAGGWNFRLLSVWRGRLDISSAVGLFFQDAFWIDHDEVGSADYWINIRNDLITARSDWVIANEVYAVLQVQTPGGPALRFGAYDAMRFAPGSGYGNNQIGPFMMLTFDNPDPRVVALDVFIRLGVYSHHAFRTLQLSTLIGVAVDWDVGSL